MPYLLELTYLGTIFAASVIIGALMLRTWAWRGAGGSQSLAWLMLAFTFSTICYLFIALMETPDAVLFWAKLRHLGLALMPVFFLLFVCEFTGEQEWLAPNRAFMLFIIPLGLQLVLWTSPTPGIFFQSWRVQRESILSIEDATYGDAWRVYVAYTYLLYGVGLFLLSAYARSVTGLRRRQALGLLLGSLVAGSLTIVQVLRLTPINVPNLTPLGYALSSALFYITLFRYRLADLMPIANASSSST